MDLDAILALSPADRGYIAGFFDGEGSVTVHDKKRDAPTFRVTITQNRIGVLVWLHSLFGGHITGYDYVSKTPNGSKYKQNSHYWNLNGVDAPKLFLKFVLPNLRVKREEVLEILHLIEHRHTMSQREKDELYDRVKVIRAEGSALRVVEQQTDEQAQQER